MRQLAVRSIVMWSLCVVLPAAGAARAAEVHPLVKAAEAMKADDMKEARRLIDTCGEEDKRTLAFFVVNAYFYACGDSYANSATASRTASRLDEKVPEPHVYLATSLSEAGYAKDALAAAEAGAKLFPGDERFAYAKALAQAASGKWKEARDSFGLLGRASGPLAAQAKAHLEEMDKYDAAVKAADGEKQKLDAKLAELKTKADRVRYAGKASEDKLNDLKRRYDQDRSQINRDFQNAVNRLRRPSDPSQQSAYQRAYQSAADEAERRRRQTDQRYRPQVSEVQTEISRHVGELRAVTNEQRPLLDQKTKLDVQLKREQAQLREKMKVDIGKALPLTPQRVGELLARKPAAGAAK